MATEIHRCDQTYLQVTSLSWTTMKFNKHRPIGYFWVFALSQGRQVISISLLWLLLKWIKIIPFFTFAATTCLDFWLQPFDNITKGWVLSKQECRQDAYNLISIDLEILSPTITFKLWWRAIILSVILQRVNFGYIHTLPISCEPPFEFWPLTQESLKTFLSRSVRKFRDIWHKLLWTVQTRNQNWDSVKDEMKLPDVHDWPLAVGQRARQWLTEQKSPQKLTSKSLCKYLASLCHFSHPEIELWAFRCFLKHIFAIQTSCFLLVSSSWQTCCLMMKYFMKREELHVFSLCVHVLCTTTRDHR